MSNKLYNTINIIIASVSLLLTAMLFIFSDHKILIGVLLRGILSLLIIFNASWLLFTKKQSFLIPKDKENRRWLSGILLLVVGLIMFITALMGYGINGYPLLWEQQTF